MLFRSEAPIKINAVSLPSELKLIVAPPRNNASQINRLDPNGSFIINQNLVPTPLENIKGVSLSCSTQIYLAQHPSIKLSYALLNVTLPLPSLAEIQATYFPVTTSQASVGLIEDATLVPAFKAILSDGTVKISLIALNTSSVQIGSAQDILPPVLIDYTIVPASGQTTVTATLKNKDHLKVVTTNIKPFL